MRPVHVLFAILSLVLAAPAMARDVGTLLNAERQKRGLPVLSVSAQLTRAAERHALDMSRRGFFDHRGSDGSTVGQRAKRQKYGYCFIAENIAQGYRSPEAVMAGWMRSRGHRKNNLDKRASEFGVARAEGDYWVLVLGRSGC